MERYRALTAFTRPGRRRSALSDDGVFFLTIEIPDPSERRRSSGIRCRPRCYMIREEDIRVPVIGEMTRPFPPNEERWEGPGCRPAPGLQSRISPAMKTTVSPGLAMDTAFLTERTGRCSVPGLHPRRFRPHWHTRRRREQRTLRIIHRPRQAITTTR